MVLRSTIVFYKRQLSVIKYEHRGWWVVRSAGDGSHTLAEAGRASTLQQCHRAPRILRRAQPLEDRRGGAELELRILPVAARTVRAPEQHSRMRGLVRQIALLGELPRPAETRG